MLPHQGRQGGEPMTDFCDYERSEEIPKMGATNTMGSMPPNVQGNRPAAATFATQKS